MTSLQMNNLRPNTMLLSRVKVKRQQDLVESRTNFEKQTLSGPNSARL
jgi:hypothetical protein